VFESYERYLSNLGRPHLVPRTANWGNRHAEWQRSLFDQTYDRGWLSDVRSEILSLASSRCVFCSTSQPSSLDHFLPKEQYPSLSILSINLIAACEPCNRKKGGWCPDEPNKQFVHPYLEVIPSDQAFIRCRPIASGVLSPKYEVVDSPNIEAGLTARLRTQFERLELDALYQAEAVIYFNERKDVWADVAAQGWDLLEEALEREREPLERLWGPNVWKAAFLSGLHGSPEFRQDPLYFLSA
jgi:hypothetical protein